MFVQQALSAIQGVKDKAASAVSVAARKPTILGKKPGEKSPSADQSP
jgi:hypothetical protein